MIDSWSTEESGAKNRVERPWARDGKRRLDTAFSEQAAKTPDSIAILCRGERLTYRALDNRSNQLARHLEAIGVAPGDRVAVALPRTPDLIVALIGVLKAGGAYVPLDLKQPPDRLRFLIADSEAAVVLTEAEHADTIFADTRCRVETIPSDMEGISSTLPTPARAASDLAYILYTSGSTGTPKGVMLRHSAMGIIDWMAQTFPKADLACFAAASSLTFDPSVIEIFGPLSWGGCLILKENLLEPFQHGEHPTVVQGPPSILDGLARRGAIPDSIRVISCGGEVLQAKVAQRLYRLTKAARVYNNYGPTEATIVATMESVPRDVREDPPLGVPVAGARIRLLDDIGEPVPEGATGEIWIGGGGVAAGYWNRPELTRERFVAEPGFDVDARMYRTGDLARYDAAGALRFVGRRERQIKIRGQRVELAEIEHALRDLPTVLEAAVDYRRNATGSAHLVAFVEVEPGFEDVDARARLQRWLPSFMVPSRIVVLDQLPRSISGKLDLQAISAIELPHCTNVDVERKESSQPLEQLIATAFAKFLHRPHCDIDDDFYALGGDSLSAYNLSLELEELLDRPVSPSITIQVSTPRTLALALERTGAPRDGNLCLLNAGGKGGAIFCLPDVFGQPVSFTTLAEVLERERPVYGLVPDPGIEKNPDDISVESLTARYVETVRRVQPKGPYCIAGYSFGGVAAFDLAKALGQAGEEVTLILVDALVAQRILSPRVLVPWIFKHGISYVRQVGIRPILDKARSSRWMPWYRMNKEPPSWVSPRSRELATALIDATRRYRVGTFHGLAILINAEIRHPLEKLLDHDGLQGWGNALRGEVRASSIATSHLKIMRYPHVTSVAQAITHLTREDARSGGAAAGSSRSSSEWQQDLALSA